MFKTPLVLAAMLLAAPGFGLAAQTKNWPAPIKAIEAQGVEIIGTFDAPGGLTGLAVIRSNQEWMPI